MEAEYISVEDSEGLLKFRILPKCLAENFESCQRFSDARIRLDDLLESFHVIRRYLKVTATKICVSREYAWSENAVNSTCLENYLDRGPYPWQVRSTVAENVDRLGVVTQA